MAERLDEPWSKIYDPDVETPGAYRKTSNHGVTIPGKTHGNVQRVADAEEDINQALCQRFGVDYPVVNIPSLLDAHPNFDRIEPQMRAMNEVLLDLFLDEHDHIYGAASISLHDPEASVQEIDRMAKEDKIIGVLVISAGQERAPGDPRYHRVYEAAADNDLPVLFHGFGTSSFMWNADGISRGINEYTPHHVLGHPFSQMWPLVSMITEGVPEKYPDLNTVLLESGIGWLPQMISRLNREYEHRQDEMPELTKTPEEYIRDQFYLSTQPLSEFEDPRHMQEIISIVGADSIMFSTDWPHYDLDTPETVESLLSHLSDEERAQIMHGNALEIFDIPV
ncbi:amidohydrolase family protein [Haloarculaceae archaeon H-GB11]|nr:amidohydrolase family protein [Haloarculaceae archaeon H-GB11]